MALARKTVRVPLLSCGVLLVVLLVGAFVVPGLIGLPRLRAQITTVLSEKMGGQVTCAALRLSVVPSPAAVLTSVVVSIPGKVDAKVASVTVFPRLLPLLRGNFELGTIRLRGPELKVRRMILEAGTIESNAARSGGWRNLSASALGALEAVAASPLAGSIIIIEDGTVEITAGSGARVRFEHVGGRLALPPDRLTVTMSSASNLWDHASLHASIDHSSAEGTARLEVLRFRPEAMGASWLPEGTTLAGSLDLAVDVSAHGDRSLHAELNSSASALTLHRGPRQLAVHSDRVGATLHVDGDATTVKLQALRLDDPRLQASGSLSIAPDAVTLDVAAADVDVREARRLATMIAGNAPVIRAIFKVLRGGTAPQITVHSQAPSLAALGAKQSLRIDGRLVDGRVHVPGVALDLDGVTGQASVADGVLVGEQISARLGKSQATGGSLRVGLSGNSKELHVDTFVQGDAGETATLLRRLVKNEEFLRQSERVREVAGTASGRLLLDGTTKHVAVTAEVSEISATARLQGLPSPLRVEGGHVRYDRNGIEASDLTLATGRSKLSEVALRILPSFEAVAGTSRIALDELYPWLRTQGWLPESAWTPSALSGTLSLRSLHLNRTFRVRGGWQFELLGSAEKLVIQSERLQQRIAMQYPLSLSQMHLRHDTETGTAFAAEILASNGLRGAIDLVSNGDRLDITDLSVHDAESDAAVALFLTPQDLSLRFKGRLTRATLDRVIENDLLAGSVRGDMRVRIRRDQSAAAVVRGRLDAQDVAVPLGGGRRVRIESVAFEGVTGGVRGSAIVDTPEGVRMQLQGMVKETAQAFIADVDLATGRLEWSAIAPWVSRGDDHASPERSNVWHRPWRGNVRVAAEAFSYGGYTWEPLRAVVAFAPGQLAVTISEANICGVATPGSIAIAQQDLRFTVKPVANNQSVEALGQCMRLGNEPATGRYSLAADVTAHGAAPLDLPGTMRGPVSFHAANGRLYGMSVTARILSFVSVGTGAVGNIANLTEEGLPYDAIVINGDLNNGILVLREATLDGPSVKWAAEGSVDLLARTLDLTLLVAPLKTVDAVVSRIPIVSGILGGSLVSIPVHVTGTFKDPTVTPLPPAAVGKGLFNVMTRTFKLPMTVIQPLLPE